MLQESDHRMLTRERDRYKDEAETARQKNRENLNQTQEGIKAFKDQVRSTFVRGVRVGKGSIGTSHQAAQSLIAIALFPIFIEGNCFVSGQLQSTELTYH